MVVLPDVPKRIVSLVPSQTELLYDLGQGDRLAGVTKFCVHPTEARFKASVVGGTKGLKPDRIIALSPDLVIANKEENEPETIYLLEKEIPVWVSDVRDLSSALNMILAVGQMTNAKAESTTIIEAIKGQFAGLEQGRQRLRAAYLIWNNPLMVAGGDTFIHSMLQMAGFENAFAGLSRYPEVQLEDMMSHNVNIVLLSSEPFPFTEAHAAQMRNHLPGVRVLLADGEMFSWYGSRMQKAPGYFHQLRESLQL